MCIQILLLQVTFTVNTQARVEPERQALNTRIDEDEIVSGTQRDGGIRHRE